MTDWNDVLKARFGREAAAIQRLEDRRLYVGTDRSTTDGMLDLRALAAEIDNEAEDGMLAESALGHAMEVFLDWIVPGWREGPEHHFEMWTVSIDGWHMKFSVEFGGDDAPETLITN